MPDFVDGLSKLGVEVNNRQKAALRRIGGPKLFESLTKIAEDSTTKRTTNVPPSSPTRTRFDEHNVFNRQVGRVIERATHFDHGTKTGGYFDARGNALLKIPRCEVADHLETEPSRHHRQGKRLATSASVPEMSREERRQRENERYSKGWAKNLDSHIPMGKGEAPESETPQRRPPIPMTSHHRSLLAGSDVRSCLVHRNRASKNRVENEHRDRHGQRISRIRRMNLVQRETNPSSVRERFRRVDRRDLVQTNQTILPGPPSSSSSSRNHPTTKRPSRPNQTNASRGVAESLQPRGTTDRRGGGRRSNQRRHFVSAEDIRNLPSPARGHDQIMSGNLQKLRNTLPQGKASAHRVLVHRFRKYDLQFTGEIDVTAFRRGLSSFGTTWNTSQMHQLLRDLDRKRSGFVDYRAFAEKVTKMSRTNTTSEFGKLKKNKKTNSQRKHFETYKADWENRGDSSSSTSSSSNSRVRVLRSKTRPPVCGG